MNETPHATLDSILLKWNNEFGLSPAQITRFHESLLEYLASDCPLFYVRGPQRRTIIETKGGIRIAPTDNSPAWWSYATARKSVRIDWAAVPTHMFEAMKHGFAEINKKRCYVAHILPAKQNVKDYSLWTKEYAVAKFVCNVHPANHFYVPLACRNIAETPIVIAHAAKLAAQLYKKEWEELVILAGTEGAAYLEGLPATSKEDALPCPAATNETKERISSAAPIDGVPTYFRSRLTFLASVIEPLDWDGRFRVRTAHGTFEFSKRDFYANFPTVVKTRSYRVDGNYNGANLHLRAEAFRVS